MLVVDCGLNPNYALDVAEEWEIETLIDRISKKDMALQQLLRLNTWATIQVNSKERIQPQDICKFGWEVNEEEPKETTKEDIENIQNKAKEFEKLWQNQVN